MLEGREVDSPAVINRQHDIFSWVDVDISSLSQKHRRYYTKRKVCIEEYFTTDAPIDQLMLRHRLAETTIQGLAKKCLMLHSDGSLWGFRALWPGVRVIDYAPAPASGDVAIQEEVSGTGSDTISNGPSQPASEEAEVKNISAPVVPLSPKSRYPFTGKRRTQVGYWLFKRRVHRNRRQQKQKKFRRFVTLLVLATVLVGGILPLGIGLAAYGAYNTMRGLALDGVSHLLNVKSILAVAKSDPFAALNAATLKQAGGEFKQSENNFLQLQQLVNRSDIQAAIQQFAPEYASKLNMARRLVQVGLDVSHLGNEVIGVALLGTNILHSSPLANDSTKPLITTNDIATIEAAVSHSISYLNDIRLQMSQVSLKDLPISDSQKTQLSSALTLLPKAQDILVQAQGLIGIVSWLLGVGHERRFLVQTMDRAELRPSGGFTGMYAVLTIANGRMFPFSLRDVTQIDYNGNGVALGRLAPPEYRSWMNFGNWGLRDSNLSGDYPTTARLNMQVFQEEGGGPVDGDISFTPTFIAHILDVTGPIKVAEYGETITAKNLEERLHYYQQNFTAIALQKQKTGLTNASARKSFTTLVGKLVLDRVRHLPVKQIVAAAKNAIKDIQSRDLEIYFANPAAEGWLVAHGYSGATDTFTTHDGFMVVQANISISKASQYVHTTEQDNVTLDAQGGATHLLTITLHYQQTGPVYGYDTYADYIRIYVPSSAQFLSGNGFDTGEPLCVPSRSGDAGCDQYKTFFPSSARYCPDGNYWLGDRGYIAGQGFTEWPIDRLGAPTALSSDLPGRAMWGGLTVTPKDCISMITLSWYVPHAVKRVAGQSLYALLVQKQGGYIPSIEINLDTSGVPIKGLKPFSFKGDLVADKLFSL